MLRRTMSYMVIAGALVPASLAFAQGQNDILRDAIEPYIPGRERARFLTAAGVDSDLDEAEFKANASANDGFVRKYDSWAALRSFDKNTDSKLDWFEADAYRRGLRDAVIAQYDKNGNKRLDGDELTAASTDLAAGKVPKIAAPSRPTVAAAPSSTPGNPGQGGRRGGFNGNPEEAIARGEQRRQEFNTQLLSQYDTDGDGKLSASERQSMPLQQQYFVKFQDLGVKHFDVNGDGKLDADEQKSVLGFGMKVREMGQGWEIALLDNDGDGVVTDAERQAGQQKGQAVAFALLPKAIKWADSDGDGQVSQAERQVVMERVAATAERQIEAWTTKFDANGDGRLDEVERDSLIKGINDDAAARYRKFDSDGDGKLNVNEMANMLDELAGEWGAKPSNLQ